MKAKLCFALMLLAVVSAGLVNPPEASAACECRLNTYQGAVGFGNTCQEAQNNCLAALPDEYEALQICYSYSYILYDSISNFTPATTGSCTLGADGRYRIPCQQDWCCSYCS